MGVYIDPANGTKEEWLKKHGQKFLTFRWNYLEAGELPVILVKNPAFTAAAIAFCEEEFDIFMNPRDERYKEIYICKISDLIEVQPMLKFYMGEERRLA